MINHNVLYRTEEMDVVDESGELQFYKTLLDVSRLFLNDDLDQIDRSVENSIIKINKVVECERVQVHVFDTTTNCCNLSYQLSESGIPKIEFEPVPLDLINDLVQILDKGEHIFISNVNELQEGLIKQALQNQGTKSILMIPMSIRNECIGFIAFEMLSACRVSYGSEIISLLNIYANMLANLIARNRDKKRQEELISKVTIQSKKCSDFSFITSHNIRSSVVNLFGIKDLIKDSLDDTYFQMLDESVKRLNDSVLHINEILNGVDNGLSIECDVRESLNSVLQLLSQSGHGGLSKVVNAVEKGYIVRTNPKDLQSIFYQVLKNSFKYVNAENALEIKLEAVHYNNQLDIHITDNGRGFNSKERTEKLFQVGARFHPDQCDGNGLGLFIAKMHVDAMGGSITLQSQIDVGTKVTITLPIIKNPNYNGLPISS